MTNVLLVCKRVFSAGAMTIALTAVPGGASASAAAGSIPTCNDSSNTQVGDVLLPSNGNFTSDATEGGVTTSATICAGEYELAVQSDGNLVIYKDNGQVPWSSHTYTGPINGDATELLMQPDGNLVLYQWNEVNNTETPLWATDTYPSAPSSDFACFQTDGNLVVYAGQNVPYSYPNPCFGPVLWASGT